MKTERSSDKLKILELFKSDNFELGVQLCKAVDLDVVDLLVMRFDDFDRNQIIKIGNIRVMSNRNWVERGGGDIRILFWGCKDLPNVECETSEIYSTMYDNFTDYKKLAVVVYNAYCESKLKNK